jgi:4-amino-4-deoxy-L-arabinose transferase-like glycosyltransferase
VSSHPQRPSIQQRLEAVPFDRRRWWPWLVTAACLVVVAVQGGLWWLELGTEPRVLWGDEVTYLESAHRLLSGNRSWWPESLWPPLYPSFIAGVMWSGGGSLAAVQIAQSLLLVLVAVLLSELTRGLTGSRAAGLVAAGLTLGYPTLVAYCHYLWPEVLHLFLFSALLWVLALRWRSPAWCIVGGVALGLALLTKSLLLPFVPVLLAAAAWRTGWRAALPRWALVVVAAAATVAPTLVSPSRLPGSPAIGGSATFNLWVGLNDVGREHLRSDVVWSEYQKWLSGGSTHPERHRAVAAKIRRNLGERGVVAVVEEQLSKQYFRLFDVSSYLTDQLPGGPAAEWIGVGYGSAGPLLSSVLRGTAAAAYVALLVAVPGGFLLGRSRSRWVRVLATFIVFNLLIFIGLHVVTRYRIQMIPAAVVGVGCLVAWLEAGCRPRPGWGRVGAAAVVVGLLLWFALG